MAFLLKNARLILFIVWIFSLVIMIMDLLIDVTEISFFYTITNAILVFRIIGVFWFTTLLHVLVFIVVFVSFAFMDYGRINLFNMLCCLVPLGVEFLLAIFLMLCPGKRSAEKRACRAGLHALLGLVVVIVFFWVCCFLINGNNVQCILEIIYMLLFLFIMLTPYFQTQTQAVVVAESARPTVSPCVCGARCLCESQRCTVRLKQNTASPATTRAAHAKNVRSPNRQWRTEESIRSRP